MKTVAISDINILRVIHRDTQKVSYGCSQEWFATEWQRRAGCGPSVASNIFLYLSRTRFPKSGKPPVYREDFAALMEYVWGYVTPGQQGIPETKMLREGMETCAEAKGLVLESCVCDVPEAVTARPSTAEITSFLENALGRDAPVAFLNLCNGEEKNLDRWHWVTIVSLERDVSEKIFLHALDGGVVKTIDLTLWRDTTTCGGGFVWFDPVKKTGTGSYEL
ncbi:MAG: hypothetical protein LBR61_04385 [Synergistaceae bacterium]|jgi:hypothetical protein|nr:hypothetical protein [Synergistaceae bacterium]